MRRCVDGKVAWRTALAGVLVALLIAPGGTRADTAREPGTVPSLDEQEALRLGQAAIGRQMPDLMLLDRQSRPVRLASYHGKPLLVSFIYTGCFQVCPTQTRALQEAVEGLQRMLGEHQFNVVSIGFNQPFDDPQAMASFARQNDVDDRRWSFLAPAASDVGALTRAFGFSYEATPKGFDHVTQVTVVDANGVVYRQVYGETFELPMLVGPLKELLSGDAARTFTLENVWTKVKLYCTVYDPVGGVYRLDYSLFFELFAGITFLGGVAWFALREYRRIRRPSGGRRASRDLMNVMGGGGGARA